MSNLRKLTGQETKQVIVEILSEFADYCDKNGLRYYLCAGTLLGAVRHKGFIPWDDDADVYMPRPDFDKFHEMMKTNPVKPYYHLEGINLGNRAWPFTKLVDERTVVKKEFTTSEKHLWIDIFPIDGLPSDIVESNKILSVSFPQRWKYETGYAKVGKGKNIIRSIAKIPVTLYLKAYGLKKCGRDIDKLARTYDFDSSEYIGEIAWSVGPKERMKKSDFLPMCDLEFEGKMFHATACYDELLKALYGDSYMSLPPVEKRVTHEYATYILE